MAKRVTEKKYMSIQELTITMEAEKRKVAPKIISSKKMGQDGYEVIVEWYPARLKDLSNAARQKYRVKTLELVKILHSAQIFHMALNSKNIVVDGDDVRIVDYADSMKFKSYGKDQEKINTMCNAELDDVEDIFQLEVADTDDSESQDGDMSEEI